MNYVDFKKVFDSIHQESVWPILRAYRILQQIILVIKSFYNNFKCRVGNSESSFGMKTDQCKTRMSYVGIALQADY